MYIHIEYASMVQVIFFQRENRKKSLTTDALKIRAPSIWSFSPCCLAISPTLSVYSTEMHLPPQLQIKAKHH